MHLELKYVPGEDIEEAMQNYIVHFVQRQYVATKPSKSCQRGPVLASPIPHDAEKHHENY